jgi:type I restriction enzyme, S subunit
MMRFVELRAVADVKLGRQRSPKNHNGPSMRAYLRAANVGWSGLLLCDVKFMNFTTAEMETFRLEYGDLLLNEGSGSPAEVGKPAIWSDELEECAFQNTLLRVRPRSEVDSRYLLHYFSHQASTGEFARGSRGVGIHHLGQQSLASWPVPLPDRDEQRRVTEILDKCKHILKARRQVVESYDNLVASVFESEFGDPLLPGPWPTRQLCDLARIVRGASPRPAGDPRYFGGEIPWLKISDLTSEPGPVVRRINETVTEAGRSKSVLLPPSSLVLTNSATVGLPKIIEPATCIHDGFIAFLDLDENVDLLWLCEALAVSRSRISSLAPEGTQKNLNIPIVKEIGICLPPMPKQRRFVEQVREIRASRSMAEVAMAEAEELYTTLQAEAFVQGVR